jgi:hypothetical protein
MACDRFQKDVSDTRRITGDWSGFLGATAQISSVAYTVPTGITATGQSVGANGLTETNYYSGGITGKEYTIKTTMTTDETPPRIKSYSYILAVETNC